MNIYYRIWVDLIIRLKSLEANKDDWQRKGMVSMSMAMAFNLGFLMAIIQRNILGRYFYRIDLPFIPEYFNNILTVVFLLFLPCVLLNYLLIFRNKRYESLVGKYHYYEGKLAVAYILGSMFIPVILLYIGMLIYR